jgi:hypothetical protein
MLTLLKYLHCYIQDHCTICYCGLVYFNFVCVRGTWPHVALHHCFAIPNLPRHLVGLISLHHQLLLRQRTLNFLTYYLLNEIDKEKKLTQYITLYSLIMMTQQLLAHIKRYLSKFHFFYPKQRLFALHSRRIILKSHLLMHRIFEIAFKTTCS